MAKERPGRTTKPVLKAKPKPGGAEPMSRLEARIPRHLYEMMERAAKLRGLTVTAYIASVVGDDARRIVEQTEIIRLSREAQIAFANALINPPAPNAKLMAAAKRHAELFGG
jgi:uncharacterized protein (DUF1778 family)